MKASPLIEQGLEMYSELDELYCQVLLSSCYALRFSSSSLMCTLNFYVKLQFSHVILFIHLQQKIPRSSVIRACLFGCELHVCMLTRNKLQRGEGKLEPFDLEAGRAH